jgi:biotin carboxyl carrier protein
VAEGIVETSQTSESAASSQASVGQAASRSELAQRLIDAPDLPAFVTELISTQATTVAGTEAVGFLIESAAGNLSLRLLAHLRHDNSTPQVRAAAVSAFQELVRPCVAQLKDGAIELGMTGDSHEPQFCLVTLLRADGEVVAISAVIARCLDLERAKQRLSSMKLVAGYFELFTLRRVAEQSKLMAESHQHVLQLSTSVATAEGFESAAMNLCNELANRAHASRVTMGWVKGSNIRVKAISHTEEFDKKQELIVSLERVMEECADQDELVQFDPGGESSQNVTREAANFSREQGGNALLSLPLRRRDEIIGVITAEFPAQQKLGPNVAHALNIAVDLLAPQLYDRYQNDRWLITKAGISVRELAKRAVGPQHMLGKLIAVAVFLVMILIFAIRPMYHVSATFEFASQANREVPAPFDGFIDNFSLFPDGKGMPKPGDTVKAGQVLAALETTDLNLELSKAEHEINTKTKEAANYRAQDKIAEEQIALSERDEAQADADLLHDKIKRATIVAPMDGQLLTGDLEDKDGSPVKTGDVLFKVGDPHDLRAELTVDDRDIQNIHAGQTTGTLATEALPGQSFQFKVTRVIPIPDPKEGTNNFRVYATITDKTPLTWRPGMKGEARINVDHRSLAWIWTHRLFDFLRLKLWM